MEEVVLFVTLFVALPWIVFSGIAKVKGAQSKGGGLRRSELRALVDDAVEDATAPLKARIETLEAIAIDEDPTRRLDAALLADLDGPEDVEEAPAAVRHRTRS